MDRELASLALFAIPGIFYVVAFHRVARHRRPGLKRTWFGPFDALLPESYDEVGRRKLPWLWLAVGLQVLGLLGILALLASYDF